MKPWTQPKSSTEFELPLTGVSKSELSGRLSTGDTTFEWQSQDTGRDAVLRGFCGLLAANMPREGLEEVVEYLREAYVFHMENRELPPPSRHEPVVTKSVASGRISRPALVL